MIFKKTLIPILVTGIGYSYTAIAAGENGNLTDNGSSWLQENNSINKIIIGENGNGNALINNGILIPKDSNGNNITENNVINIKDTTGLNIDTVYGGYCQGQNQSCSANNTAVVVDNGANINSILGASSTSSTQTDTSNTSNTLTYTNKAVGSAYLNSGSASNDMYGAQTSTDTTAVLNANGGSIFTVSNGTSYTNEATGNAHLNSGSVNGSMYGAHTSANATASLNVHSNNTYSATNNANYTNEVTGNAYLNGGSVGDSIYGAYVESTAAANVSTENYSKATATNSANFTNKVTGNVYLNGGSVGSSAYGAYSSSNASTNAFMNVSFNEPATTKNTSTFNNQISGNLSLTGTTVNGNIYGAASNDSSTVIAKANMSNTQDPKVTNNATITSNVKGNVAVDGGTINGNIYGAHSSVTATTTTFNNANHTTTFNITNQGNVSLSGNVNVNGNAEIWGGYLDNNTLATTPVYYEIFKGNTFTMSSSPITVSKIGNFENYNFNLNNNNKTAIANNQALVTVTDTMQNDNTVENDGTVSGKTTANKSTVSIAGISGTGIVKKGDTITLIDSSGASSFNGGDNTGDIGGLFNTQTGDTTKNIKVGLVGKADVSYTVDTANNKILATVDDISVSKDDVTANVKPLAEGRLAALQNTTRGADLLLDVMGKNKAVGTFTPIFVIDGGLYKYNSGSHIRTRDYRTMLGTRYQFTDNFYAGVAFEYGRSNYDTYNKFNSVNVNGNGHTYNYGASIFGKYTYNLNIGELYTDAAFRFGRTRTEFKSHDIITGSGSSAKYKSDANYVGGLVGTGFIYSLNNTSSFDTSAHYFYDQLRSDSVVIDGDKVNFKRATSSRAQLKEQYNYKLNNLATLYFGGMYEYEFDSKAHANTAGISIDAPSVKGSTGALELGVKATPFVKNKDLTVNMGVKGYVGKRKGGALSLSVNYDF